MEQMKKHKAKLDQEKDTIQTLISNAVSKWRERDQNKAKLKILFEELKQTSTIYDIQNKQKVMQLTAKTWQIITGSKAKRRKKMIWN